MRVGVLTGGGDCPGLNAVIRAVVRRGIQEYGLEFVGFRDGWRGPLEADTVPLDVAAVRGILPRGGTILGSSRTNPFKDTGSGRSGVERIKDNMSGLGVDALVVIGGEDTLGAAGRLNAEGIPVVGVPKTIDNDIPFIDQSFGFQTAFARAADSIRAAHVEAESHHNGVGLVKLMGRHSGFIACYASLAFHDVDVVLIPEVPFALEGPGGLLEYVHRRVDAQGHCLVVLAEGAGQDLMPSSGTDASGNAKLADVGAHIRERIIASFANYRRELTLRYVDPGYAIRSVPANGADGVYCTRLAYTAVHAALSGCTEMIAGRWHGRFVHLPMGLVTSGRNLVDPDGDLWLAVLEATGQPPQFRSGVSLDF
jgi:6-phosphofructokinase 1